MCTVVLNLLEKLGNSLTDFSVVSVKLFNKTQDCMLKMKAEIDRG